MKIGIKTKTDFSAKASVPESRISISSEALSPLDNNLYGIYNKKRPLKTNSQNLAFKGLSLSEAFYKNTKAEGYAKEELEVAKKVLGSEFSDLYNFVKKSDYSKKMFQTKIVNGKEKAFFNAKKPLLLLLEGIAYPFKRMPGDILNAIVLGLKKVKPLENWAGKLYNGKFLKTQRQKSKIEAQVNSIRGIFEKTEALTIKAKGIFKNIENDAEREKKVKEYVQEKILEQSGKMFDPKTGNYDTKYERSLCRIVSGMIPAVFLANDAYNLSSMCSSNSKEAKTEQKTRMKQEISRVGFNAYLTLITMGALQKYTKSKTGIMINTTVTVLLTEMFSRLSNGKHITMLSSEQAKKINAKQNKNKVGTAFQADKAEENDKKDNKQKEVSKNEKQKDPLLSLSTIMKASLGIIAAGFAIKGLRQIKTVNKFYTDFQNGYKKIYEKLTVNPNYTYKKEKMDYILGKIKDAGFEDLAKQYENIIKTQNLEENGLIKLGEKNKKIKLLYDFVKAPFKFMYDTISLPYRMVNKLVELKMKKKPNSQIQKENPQIVLLRQCADKIWAEALNKGKKYDKKKLADFINDSIAKSFNAETMSMLPNNELANIAKNSATAATIWFLMADNYNMVMLKSNGEDKQGAQLKAKQRVVQEASRLFYQTLLIDLFNSTFRVQYNNSLFGMSWITATNTTIGEILTRKSVGMPVKAHSKEELERIEDKKEKATGFSKSYYDFMTKLTGKQSLKEQRVAKQEKTKEKSKV